MASGHKFEPRILGFLCNWCCYAGADLAGVSRFQYPPNMRVIRLMCSGRVDPAHIFRAFATGQDAVFIGGCHLNDCHYVTHGNYDALAMVYVCKKLMEHIGLNPERLRLEWVSAGEGILFAGIMNEFVPKIEKLGPIGKGEGLDGQELKSKLEAVTKLIPYIKLVLSERLRVAVRTEEAYTIFFAGNEFNRLFDELIGDKLVRYPHIPERTHKGGIGTLNSDRIEQIINKHKREARSLVQVLLEIQQESHWLSQEVLDKVSKELDVPLSRIMHIVTFHKTFSLIPKGRNE
jgi:F420-non-reducing hydrogenase iron-sulfur subunit